MRITEIFNYLIEGLPGESLILSEAPVGDSFITVSSQAFPELMPLLRNDPALAFDNLRLISSIDHGTHFTVVYHLASYTHSHSLCIHVDLPHEKPSIESVTPLWPGANWQEREAFDMMGIVFKGHPALQRILLPLDWEGHPLRKDYVMPEEYHGIKHN